ncbi:three-helix bundle dimerization domain-containing protein [Streptomyces sp. NPDC048385]|uniref:three-helix bundle dimerization domain-containing protein n=1 Tax=unclassified Streptomyces TaxID=2593676 RepID=UPI00341408E4
MLIEPDEDVAIQRVAARLGASCGGARTPSEVETAVAMAYASLRAVRIRVYVPVLVERKARRILREHGGRTPVSRLGGSSGCESA